MSRAKIINIISEKLEKKINKNIDQQNYLEIGIMRGETFKNVQIKNKDAIDPNPSEYGKKITNFKMTSDDFFSLEEIQNKKYDIIFVDGMHLSEFALRDVINSLKHINPKGFIIIDDILPKCERHQLRDRPKPYGPWTGDVWKTWITLMSNLDLNQINLTVVEGEDIFGVGVIEIIDQVPECKDIKVQNLDYNNYKDKLKNLFNPITISELKKL